MSIVTTRGQPLNCGQTRLMCVIQVTVYPYVFPSIYESLRATIIPRNSIPLPDPLDETNVVDQSLNHRRNLGNHGVWQQTS